MRKPQLLRRLAAAAVSLAVGASITLTTVPAAHAATCSGPTIVASSTATPVIVLTPTTGARTRLALQVADCPGWGSEVHFIMNPSAGGSSIEANRSFLGSGHWTGSFLWDPYDASRDRTRLAGRWTVRLKIIAIGPDFDVVPHFVDAPKLSFSVLKAATMVTTASAKSVRKAKPVTITGVLKQADLETHAYTGYANRPVQLQFKKPKSSYRTIKSVRTSAGGAVKTTVKPTQSGCYRYVYAGDTTTTTAASKEVCLTVR